MRQIKFRAWDKKENRMLSWEDIEIYPYGIRFFGGKIQIREKEKECVLMQFTGLLDKNSKEIYEGDILITRSFGKEHYREVKYSETYGRFYSAIEDINLTPCFLMGVDGMEVVGNIYQQPELIK